VVPVEAPKGVDVADAPNAGVDVVGTPKTGVDVADTPNAGAAAVDDPNDGADVVDAPNDGVGVVDPPNDGVVDTPNAGVDTAEGATPNPVVELELPNPGVAGTFPKPEEEELPNDDGPPEKGKAELPLAPNPPPNSTGGKPNPLAGAAPKPAPNPEGGGAAPNPPNRVGDGFGASGEPNGVLGGADPKPPPKPDMLKQTIAQAISPLQLTQRQYATIYTIGARWPFAAWPAVCRCAGLFTGLRALSRLV
jgi:hypothetical protein